MGANNDPLRLHDKIGLEVRLCDRGQLGGGAGRLGGGDAVPHLTAGAQPTVWPADVRIINQRGHHPSARAVRLYSHQLP
ncbi:hypothetical protein CIB48_g8976 [Xylaria polymorpha]|nr:hypothetical protein CIB48_g8976 [Xylaria polymorpha]